METRRRHADAPTGGLDDDPIARGERPEGERRLARIAIIPVLPVVRCTVYTY
ncbi:hypothetical protein HH1059_03840 [Halorhodospira halochloris]|uniref:Uncharacterized protein n=1 Tax=Halorhodospira halochloris TaxID=1052 RepID=A0A2Z6EZE0_HALHR|nr:hypothetical protein HH1059_03840 [Halorhodospira halochloris]